MRRRLKHVKANERTEHSQKSTAHVKNHKRNGTPTSTNGENAKKLKRNNRSHRRTWFE